MRTVIQIFFAIFLFFTTSNFAMAEPVRILVLPADSLENKSNAYGFPEVSEIIAIDVLDYFNNAGKIISPSLDSVLTKFSSNSSLQVNAANVLKKYKNSNSLDYPGFKKISGELGIDYILVITSDVMTKDLHRNLWEILQISSAFDICSPFTLTTSALLIDAENETIMWSGKYKKSLNATDSSFSAKSSGQINSQFENIRMYSHDIAAKSIAQNVTLRMYPKTIRPAAKPVGKDFDGSIMKFDKTIPQAPKDRIKPKGYIEGGEMIFSI